MDLLSSSPSPSRKRLRDIFPSIVIGRYPTGPKNSLTDVTGVLVHTQSIRQGDLPASNGRPRQLAQNTGVTTILPRKDWFDFSCHAGIFIFNGSGEMTGSHWIAETGQLASPIILTGSFGVGSCYNGVYKWAIREKGDAEGEAKWFLLPVVAETFDGYMHDVASMPVTADMVVQGIDSANADPVQEGNTGGGTGMMCMGFKSGTGSSSRLIRGSIKSASGHVEERTFTLGVLVQANFGAQWDLHFGRVPIGRLLMEKEKRDEWEGNLRQERHAENETAEDNRPKDGSIIIIVATDAPLHPTQCQRLAKRATVGLSRAGGWGSNTSGDVFLAFSTANHVPRSAERSMKLNVNEDGPLDVLDNQSINGLFEAAADATEESVCNALCMAEDCVGPLGREAKAIPLDRVAELLKKHYVH